MIPLNVYQNIEVEQYIEKEQPLSFVTPIPKNNVLYIQFYILHSFVLGVQIKSTKLLILLLRLPPDWCVTIVVIVFEIVSLIFFLVGYKWSIVALEICLLMCMTVLIYHSFVSVSFCCSLLLFLFLFPLRG